MKTTLFINSTHVRPGSIWHLLFVCIVMLSMPCSGAPNHEQIFSEKQTHQPDDTAKDNLSDSRTPIITLYNGKVTINIPSTTLNNAINKISSITGIEILWQGEENQKLVSIDISERSIEEAIQMILRGENFLLIYSDTQRGPVISKVVILPSDTETDYQDRYDDYEDAYDMSPVSIADANPPQGEEKFSEATSEMEMAIRSRIEGMNRVRSISMQNNQYQAIEDLKVELLVNDEAEARLLALTSLHEKGEITAEMLMDRVSTETDPRVQLHAVNLLVKIAENDSMVEGFLTSFFEGQKSTK